MPARSLQQAKWSFVTVLLTIAALYSVRLTVTRDSSDEDCAKAFKRVSLKARPDKHGHRLLKVPGPPLRLFSWLFRCGAVTKCCIFEM